jgi:hypothetical protein
MSEGTLSVSVDTKSPMSTGMVALEIWPMTLEPVKKIRPQLRGRDSDVEARMHLPMKWESSLVRGNDRTWVAIEYFKEFEQLAPICEQETNDK